MDQLPFASFEKVQLTFELRYEPAYLIWDNAGHVWTAIAKLFKQFKSNRVTPNEVIFHADERFAIKVSLERAYIIDYLPERSFEKTVELFAKIQSIVTDELQINVITRVGTTRN